MCLDRVQVVLVLLVLPAALEGGDVEVSCEVGGGSCVLPCRFEPSSEEVIHWIQETAGEAKVHSYYYNKDQLGLQNERFSNRTLLFLDQVPRGNASLLLAAPVVPDQGRYKCYCGTINGHQEAFIQLRVDAPVRDVNLSLTGNRFTCSSEGIHPKPKLTWSTEPADIGVQNDSTVVQNQEELYSISNFLEIDPHGYESVSCTVQTPRNKRKVTYRKPQYFNVSDTEKTIPCGGTLTPQTGLVWRFNQTRIVLTQRSTGDPYKVLEEWKKYVKEESESGSLTLTELSSELAGLYTCEVKNDEETIISDTYIRIKSSDTGHQTAIILSVVGVLVALGVLFLTIFFTYKKRKAARTPKKRANDNDVEMRPMNGGNGDVG